MAQAEAGKLPRIGELVEAATGVKFDSYKDAQNKLGLETAMAAIASNPDYRSPEGKTMATVVDELLLKQADLRQTAVKNDIEKVVKGETLEGLPVSSFLMVKTADAAAPGLEATLETAKKEMKDPAWLRAEGASNVTNMMRDTLTTVNGHPMNAEQKIIVAEGIKAGGVVADALISGKPLEEATGRAMGERIERAMDTAIEVNPGIKETAGYKANYENYRVAMRAGRENGLEAVKMEQAVGQAKDAIVETGKPADGHYMPSNAPAVKKGGQGR